MLLPSPEIQKRLEKYSTINAAEAKAIQFERQRLKRRRAALYRTFAGLALLGVGASAYADDVEANQTLQAEASIGIQIEGEALDATNGDNALIFIDGFGTYSSSFLTKHMSKAIQPVIDGQLWSVDYNNAPLETNEIAKKIIQTATEENVTSISLVGYSAGGDVVMQVQEEVRKSSDLEIEALVLISTPDGVKALRPARQDEIDLVEKFAWIPGIEYSTPLRFLGELAMRSDRYNSGTPIEMAQNFIETATDVDERFRSNKLPGTWLMFDQKLAIENSDLKGRINEMKDIPPTETRPTIIYLGTKKPGYDYMVDDKKSSDNIDSYADKAGIPFLSYDVKGAVHTRVDLANDEYIATLKEAKHDITSSIESEKTAAELNRTANTHVLTTPLPE